MKKKLPNHIRPTTQKVLKAIFDVLYSHIGNIQGLEVLDLFAGNGQIGLQCLDKGSSKVVFVDASYHSQQTILPQITKYPNKAVFLKRNLELPHILLDKLEDNSFDIVFLDPPYEIDFDILEGLFMQIQQILNNENSICILESRRQYEPKLDRLKQYLYLRQLKTYGDTQLSFWSLPPN